MKAESKAIIFGRYFGQKVLYNGCELVYVNHTWNWFHPSNKLQLKPLSSISDEHAKLLEVNEKLRGFITIMPYYHDPLSQLGYATPQTVIEDGKVVTYSVEELVINGTFKLI